MDDLLQRLEHLETLVARLEAHVVLSDSTLWSRKDIASYAGVSEQSIRRVIDNNLTFPSPIEIATGGVRPKLRWHADEVREWFKTQRAWVVE